MKQNDTVLLIDKSVLYLLLIYLEKQRRLCAQARENDNFTWEVGKGFYEENYRAKFSLVIRQMDQLMRDASGTKQNPVRRLFYLNYLLPFSRRLPVSSKKIESIHRCFTATDRLYTAEQEPTWETMQENMVFAAEIMDSFHPWLNPEKRMKEWTHIPEIGYSKEPPVSIDDIMRKHFRQSEESILNSIIRDTTSLPPAD